VTDVDRPLRVALFVNQFPVVSETFILDQITGLLDRGHDVDIYARSPGDATPEHPAVQAYGLMARTRYFIAPENRLRRLADALRVLAPRFRQRPGLAMHALNPVRHGRDALTLAPLYLRAAFVDRPAYDVIHCHYGTIGRMVVRFRDEALIAGKLVTTFHGFDATMMIREHGTPYYKKLFDRGDLFLPVSEYLKGNLLAAGCPPSRIHVHHMGVDCANFQPRPRPPQQEIRLLSVARLVEKKGLEFSIRAVAELRDEYPQIRYRVVGDGPLRCRLEELVHTLNADRQVLFAGWRDRDAVLEEMQRADVFLAPSVTSDDGNEEGIPVGMMEAMAVGLPVVSTYHSGVPELVAADRTGVLVPQRDTPALVAALRGLLKTPETWATMGTLARQTIQQHYNNSLLQDQLVLHYRKMLAA